MKSLDGKVAFITGTAGGQGRAAALLFAAAGAHVVACDLDPDAAAETAAMIEADGGTVTSSAPVDLSDREAAAAWIEAGVNAAGALDVLYNKASAQRVGPFEEFGWEDWEFTIHN